MEPLKGSTPPYFPHKKEEKEKINLSPKEIRERKTDISARNVLSQTHEPQKFLSKEDDQLTISRLAPYSEINEPDIDPDMELELDDVLTSNLREIQIPTDSAFIGTDLVIFKDKYSGSMPINAIKESRFNEITLLLNKICTGDSKIKNDKADPNFANKMEEAIKMLLTREIGRKMIEKICNSEKDLRIVKGESQYIPYTRTIVINPEDSAVIEMHPSGKRQISAEQPLFLSLGHEMIHAAHDNPFGLAVEPPTMGKEYHNLEEQITIVGLKKNLVPISKDLNDNWEPIVHNDYYYELNERNLTAAFADKQYKWYPRIGHIGIDSKKAGTKDYIITLIRTNVLADIEKLVKDNTNLNKIFAPESPIVLALQAGSLDVLRFLLNIYQESVNTKSYGTTPFLVAVKQYEKNDPDPKYLLILDMLHEAKADINAVDNHGNSALHYMLQKYDKEGIKKFLGWGGNPQLKNFKEQTAIDFVCKGINEKNEEIECSEYVPPKIINEMKSELLDVYECIKLIEGENRDNYIFEHNDQIKLLQNIFNFCDYEFSVSLIDSYYNNTQDINKISNINKIDDLGNNFLHYMLRTGNISGAQKLLNFGCYLGQKNNQGLTPIELAFVEINKKLTLENVKFKYFRDRILSIGDCIKSIKEDCSIDEKNQKDLIIKLSEIESKFPKFTASFIKLFNINK